MLDALRHITHRGRDGIDAARVEVGPHDARAHHAVAVRREPALYGLVGGVGEREHEPCRVRARRRRPHGHASADAIGPRRGFDLQGIAAPLVGLAESGDLDAIEIVADGDRLERVGCGHVHEEEARKQLYAETGLTELLRLDPPRPGFANSDPWFDGRGAAEKVCEHDDTVRKLSCHMRV